RFYLYEEAVCLNICGVTFTSSPALSAKRPKYCWMLSTFFPWSWATTISTLRLSDRGSVSNQFHLFVG
ncbi:hypothetical protein ACFLYE_04630, partial [Chloroflexota bacterium]